MLCNLSAAAERNESAARACVSFHRLPNCPSGAQSSLTQGAVISVRGSLRRSRHRDLCTNTEKAFKCALGTKKASVVHKTLSFVSSPSLLCGFGFGFGSAALPLPLACCGPRRPQRRVLKWLKVLRTCAASRASWPTFCASIGHCSGRCLLARLLHLRAAFAPNPDTNDDERKREKAFKRANS